MSAISHSKSNTLGDFTGTVTVFNSQGSTATAAATDLVRPGDWNSAHNVYLSISGAAGNTFGSSTASGTNVVLGFTDGMTGSMSTAAGGATIWFDAPSNPVVSDYFDPPSFWGQTIGSSVSNGNMTVRPMLVPYRVEASRFEHFASVTVGTAGNNSSCWIDATMAIGLYTLSNATKLNRLSDTTYGFTTSWNSNTGAGWSGITGVKAWTAPWNVTLTPGQYYLAYGLSTTNTGAGANTTNLAVSINMVGAGTHASMMNSSVWGAGVPFGVSSTNAGAMTAAWARFFGVVAGVTTSSAPATIDAANVSNTGVNLLKAPIVVRFRNV